MIRYFEEEDLLRFMIKEEVDLVMPLFEGIENGRVERKVLTSWVVRPVEFHLKNSSSYLFHQYSVYSVSATESLLIIF